MLGELLNAGDNVDDQEYFGFTGEYLKNCPYIYRWLYKKEISKYATRKLETHDKYREQWQTNWWKISEKNDWWQIIRWKISDK